MNVLIKADDPSLLADALKQAVDEALDGDDRGLALEELAGEELTPGSVVDAARTPPFLTSRRVLVVRDVGRFTSDDLEPLIAYLAAPEATSHLILVAGGGQTSQKLVNAIKKHGELRDAAAPSQAKARTAWITDRLKESSLKFDAGAGTLIADHLGEDLGRLPGLIDTLEAVYGPQTKVGSEDVEPYLGDAGGIAPWDLTDAIDRGDSEAALGALHRMDRHPMVVLASLHRHYAAMLRLEGSDIRGEQDAAAAVGMAPYPAKKALTQANRLGGARIGRAIELLAAADMDLRGMKEWPDGLVLEVLVARLTQDARLARR